MPLTPGEKSFPLTACHSLLAAKVLRSPHAAHFWREKYPVNRRSGYRFLGFVEKFTSSYFFDERITIFIESNAGKTRHII